MQSKIKQITLTDGKQLFYPSEEEVKKLQVDIASVIIEETMNKEEFISWIASADALTDTLINGVGITRIEPKEYWYYCSKCDRMHNMVMHYNIK